MYAAIDLAEEKLARQLRRHKERLTDHHREEIAPTLGGPEGPAGPDGAKPPVANEETYEDVIDRLADGGDQNRR
jgi:hypothetical protein